MSKVFLVSLLEKTVSKAFAILLGKSLGYVG